MAGTILIVDDDPVTRRTLCEFFKAEERYKVCAEASSGQEAIDVALKHRPELIILDLSMPGMNGIQASRELKRLMPNVPIILFSEYAALGNRLLEVGLMVDRMVSKGEAQSLIEHVTSLSPM